MRIKQFMGKNGIFTFDTQLETSHYENAFEV